MVDILLFVIGIISILLINWFEIKKFKNKKYNPKIFALDSECSTKKFVLFSGYIIPVLWIQDKVFSSILVLIAILVLGITFTTLDFLCYQSNKNKKIMIQRVIFDITMIIFAIIIVSLL